MAKEKGASYWLSLIVPIILAVGLFGLFLSHGPLGVFEAAFPPIEDVVVENVFFSEEAITLNVINNGPETVTIAQMFVDEILWKFSMDKSDNTLEPLERGQIHLSYPWVEGYPIGFKMLLADGVGLEHEVDIAFMSPTFNWTYVKSFALLGLYVGVIPVLLGLLWFPFLRKLEGEWFHFLLSLTIGLLLFLGVDALHEAWELVEQVPSALNGVGIMLIGFILAILILQAVTNRTELGSQADSKKHKALTWAYLISLGIGLHNLGEGLAIGSAYAVGEIALGGSLVFGFMLHNLTEGIAIVSPITKQYKSATGAISHIVLMGIIAGVPTIFGALLGGFAFSAPLAVFFLAIGAGAVFDVVYDIAHGMAKGKWRSLFTVLNCVGFLLGMLIMYMTGLVILG